MLNQYPLWKYLMLAIVLVAGSIYALPNLYGEDPSVQISHRSQALEEGDRLAIEQILSKADIAFKQTELADKKVLVRFDDELIQLKAADALKDALDKKYLVALNLAAATPDWLRSLNASPMYLGLDLRGGIHFLMEVDMHAAIKRVEESLLTDIRSYLREEKIRYRGVRRDDNTLYVEFRDAENLNNALPILKRQFRQLEFILNDEQLSISAKLTEVAIRDEKKFALQQNIITLRNRVNELGVAEPIIQQQGDSRIVVQLPGVQDSARAKAILGGTATLEFRLTEGDVTDWYSAEDSGRVPVKALMYHERNGNPVLLSRRVIVTGDMITDAASTIDTDKGVPAVSVSLNGKGAK
ncbi:MAG: protein translocase subunit SecD, partial [Gammaproteobacteria bacterium]|nr:protein translocase subunit SecD [Gammaproteobacteria bacterium]